MSYFKKVAWMSDVWGLQRLDDIMYLSFLSLNDYHFNITIYHSWWNFTFNLLQERCVNARCWGFHCVYDVMRISSLLSRRVLLWLVTYCIRTPIGVGYIGVEYIGKVLKMAKTSHTRCKLHPHIFFTPCFVCFGFYTLHTRNMTPKHRNTSCKHMILRVYTVFFCVLGSR